MLVICCNQCQDRLIDDGFKTYVEAESARRVLGYVTGQLTPHGEEEVLCTPCSGFGSVTVLPVSAPLEMLPEAA
ncbi:hypothetical protein EF847_06685 [Actinobacteria bacterium YIM 96077]|uniref:Uncharacterized protein n=1 Tax=Phytoactinopolyspora halophila TaxID=1981511 RepID=A0A329QI32_9ACTN|nr:hypothetical protein EF847_06685 [Actinobacteria bacterium YIM 96077]RAW11984.1 hypothetical protein DPM12_14985 [Phytoactinopolyspora halophila]